MEYDCYNEVNIKKKKPLWLKITGSIFSIIILLFIALGLYINFSFEYHPVKGPSMYPTLNASSKKEDCVFVSKSKDITYGDIIIYKPPQKDILVIKRLIALGGDCIKIVEDGTLGETGALEYYIYIMKKDTNTWEKIDDKFASSKEVNYQIYLDVFMFNKTGLDILYTKNNEPYIKIPEAHFFALGDNRDNSNDSSEYGAVAMDRYYGKVEYIAYKGNLPIFQVIGQMIGGKKWK